MNLFVFLVSWWRIIEGDHMSLRLETNIQELTFNNKKLTLGERTLIMGILNVTPDSFSDGGKFNETTRAVDHAIKMIGDALIL